MINSVVIGASGFIGQHLGSALVGRGRCVGYDLAESASRDFEIRPCNIARESVEFPGNTDAVFYLAQFPGYRAFPTGGGDLWAVNVAGALRAIEAARTVGARAFIYASTGTVYAPDFEPLKETCPVRRDDPYALSKVAAEEALALVDAPPICCVRLFGVFGPGQKTMLVPALASRIRDGRAVTLEAHPHDPDDRDGLRISLTDVSDVCRGMIALAERMIAGSDTPRILNLAAREAVSIRHAAEAIGRVVGVQPHFEPAGHSRTGDYIADTTLMQQILKFETTPFDAAIVRALAPHAL